MRVWIPDPTSVHAVPLATRRIAALVGHAAAGLRIAAAQQRDIARAQLDRRAPRDVQPPAVDRSVPPQQPPAWRHTKAARHHRIYVSTGNSPLQAYTDTGRTIRDVRRKYLRT